MLRWRLTLGVLATLLILLLVGIYGVYLFHSLGSAFDQILKDNYDSIKVCHFLRLTTARVNIYYSRGDRPNPPYDQTAPLEQAQKEVNERMPILWRNARDPQEAVLVRDLQTVINRYFDTYRRVFAEFAANNPHYRDTRAETGQLTLQITNLAENILQRNEQQMLAANNRADQQTKDSIRLLILAMSSAVVVFVFTYVRLGQSLITPIRSLTRSIRELRARHFEKNLPVVFSDELGELTNEFNGMAMELRNFYRETDRKFIELNQVIRAMMTTLPYPLFILDGHDALQRLNPAAERFLNGLGSPGRLPPVLEKYLAKTPVSGRDYTLIDLKQAFLFRLDAQEYYFLPRVFPIVLEDGSLFGRALMLLDVTRFRWLDDLKSDMLATLSHEIKTPLTNIRLVLHLLLEKSTGPLQETQEDLVSSARDDCERLLRTLTSLLDLARIESGKAQLDLKPTDPCVLITDAAKAFEDPIRAAGRSLAVEMGADLPPVQADRDRVALVLSNLLSNAIKYSTPGSTITLRAQGAEPNAVRFTVINFGAGLAESEQSRVFDKFYRVANSNGEGAGLGLSIAREIIHAHEGRIGVHSQPGKVTEFYFDLPKAAGEMPQKPQAEECHK
ncbi:MAG: HAMP domain-containing protein [Verrucomicrobia bacterium]|nr:HAMP domain-containing protein [Verrucomicrobiota bacterium]